MDVTICYDVITYCRVDSSTGLQDAFDRVGEKEVLNWQYPDGTPLHLSAKHGGIKCTEKLIKAGADVNAKNLGCGSTPLHGAAMCDSILTMEMLVEAGAILDPKDNNGNTPLHQAAFFDSRKCIMFLLNAANFETINVKNNEGQTFLDLFRDEDFKKEIEDRVQYISTLDIKEPSC